MRIKYYCLLLTTLLFTSCNKDEEITCPEDEQWTISERVEGKVAYKGDEKLRFLHVTDSTHDTVVFQGKGRVPYTFIDVADIEHFSGGRICTTEAVCEAYYITFDDVASEDSLVFRVEAVRDDGDLILEFGEREMRMLVFFMDRPDNPSFQPDTVINGNYFFWVNYYPSRGKFKDFDVYYSQAHGIVLMKIGESESYYLMPD